VAEPNGVIITGLDETRRQMRQFAPDLLKEMNTEVRRILQPLVTDAKNMVPSSEPLSRWNQSVNAPRSRASYSSYGSRWDYGRLEWDSARVKRGIRVVAGRPRSRRDSFKGAYAIRNADAAGAVYELMGSGKSRVNMVGNVRARHGSGKRLIWRAWDKARAKSTVPRKVTDTIRQFEKKFQERLNSRGTR
jgi:hypothetical protein